MNDYILSQLRNAEEAPAYFNMLSNYSGDGSGAKSVVMTSGNEKIWTTIKLAVLTDGNM